MKLSLQRRISQSLDQLADLPNLIVIAILGNQKSEQQIDRCAVYGIEIHRFIESQKSADAAFEAAQSSVGHRHGPAEPRAAEALTLDQALYYFPSTKGSGGCRQC